MIRSLFVILALFFGYLQAESNHTELNETNASSLHIQNSLMDYNARVAAIDHALGDNIWLTRFANYLNYQELSRNLEEYEKEMKKTKNSQKLDELNQKIKTTSEQLLLLKEYESTPFATLLQTPAIEEIQRIHSPFAIASGYSSIKHLQSLKKDQKDRLESVNALIIRLIQKEELLVRIHELAPSTQNKRNLDELQNTIKEFRSAYEIGKTTYNVYEKRVDENIQILSNDIKVQFKKAINIWIMIFFVFFVAFVLKKIVKKYIKDDENVYLASKIINVVNYTLVILILLFEYIDNMSYFITVLGFASAGLAIAMKDMFMSMLGWVVIVFGGSFQVGDRIRVHKNQSTYVGDIIDISLLRMTIYEDITYQTWKFNKRAGRIIFIPNNYIFTDLISNYTHHGMKTVWDGIDILLTFDSNHKKAMYIIKNIVRKYSKGYTDIAKKQMSKLRNQYSIKNPNVEPRIFSFFEPYGIQISVWYMTNSYATLGLRSNISAEILEALRVEDDISIAYPVQTINFGQYKDKIDIEKIAKDQIF